MIEVSTMTEYDGDVAEAMGKLRQQLSARHDGSPIARERIEELIESPYHDILLAFDEQDKIVAMAIVSVVMTTLEQNAYLEDLVVNENCRGRGVGGQMLEAIKEWGRRKNCRRLEFTSSNREKKAGAAGFYESHGAEIRQTNCFRVEL
ncbi:GNAT family N-acetyltransferase [Candidatus Saccharibacteria bacterium]|nr:GNAT family N-acetyltransferase [Candidatus Saccharibacteria bacterium]